MQIKRLIGAPGATQGGVQRAQMFEGFTHHGIRWGRCVGLAVALTAAATTLSACKSGHGGDNGTSNPPQASGATFAYPYKGQQDVRLATQIVVKFSQALAGKPGKALALRSGKPSGESAAADISADSNQAGIVTIAPDTDLKPDTQYYIVATQDLDNTSFGKGDTITQFKTGPMPGRPAATEHLEVTETTPGNKNPVTGHKSVFTEFNAVHVVFSEPVEAASVVKGDTFKFTNADGDEVPGRLTVIGHELTFDPTEDLEPGKYKLALSNDIQSKFGKSLKAYSETKTVLDAGQMSTENLTVKPSSKNVGDLPTNNLGGGPVNLVRITNQLIGLNQQPAMNVPARQGITTTLAEGNQPGFGDVIAATIRGGQKFQLTPLNLKLNGDVPTHIKSGPIQVQFANDADVYLKSNKALHNITTPTAVQLRFDLAISTLIEASSDQQTTIIQSLADGLFNQTALNIQAAGLAIPQDNGDLKIDTLGSFPILVNRTDRANVDFELSLTLSADNQKKVQKDTTPPYLVSQSPSACLYTFGQPGYDSVYADNGAAPTALPEQNCADLLQQGDDQSTQSGINSYPVDASPALVFSEPLDPTTVNDDSIQLTSSNGDTKATYQVDGSSVVIDPQELLEPDTQYTIQLGNGEPIKDVAGNKLTDNPAGNGPGRTIKFTTEPLVDDNPAPPILGELTPGIPCALDGGDPANGVAGQCVGDADNDTTEPYPVFQSPANVPVTASFSKLVQKDSIKLADGCLTGGGNANSVSGATVALEQIDGSGQCAGTPDAGLAFANRNGDMTRGFSIRPVENLEPGNHYQIVVCGTDSSACSATIVGADGYALNTDPLNGTASTGANTSDDVAGGPDILMPFDATPVSDDYYATQYTVPYTDTNGNGKFDDGEHGQPANVALIKVSALEIDIQNPDRDDELFASYLGLQRPIVIGKTLDDCSAVENVKNDDDESVIAEPDHCIQVKLLPGGLTDQSNFAVLGGLKTGRVLLRYPYEQNDDGSAGPQSAYIVPECKGTLPSGEDYDYSPCFAASQTLVANAPDAEVLTLDQQTFKINLVGPVSFEQNGRLVVSLHNVNTFSLDATLVLGDAVSSKATIEPNKLHFQLAGSAPHGGKAFPQR